MCILQILHLHTTTRGRVSKLENTGSKIHTMKYKFLPLDYDELGTEMKRYT